MKNFLENNESPILTMGLLVYNEEKNVAEAIENLLAQTYKNFVLIISDNASTDRTPEICKSYAEKDKRIVYIRQEKNMGALFNFRFVAQKAKTPFFMWCSGNDKWDPTFVEKLLPAFSEDDIILSYPEAAMINLDGTVSPAYEDDNTTVGIDNKAKRYLYFLWRFRTRISNMFYGIWRTEALNNCSLDIVVVAQDIVILHEASLEGKFKMRKEVLFWMKRPSAIKNNKKRMLKVFSDLTARKFTGNESVIPIVAQLAFAIIAVPFNKRYSLSFTTRVWLSFNAVINVILTFYVEPILYSIFKKIMPENLLTKLKSIYKKII